MVVKFVTFAAFWGSLWDGSSYISFIINIVILVLAILTIFLTAGVYRRFGRLPALYARFTLALNDIFLPLMAPWGFASIALAIGTMISSGFDSALFALCVLVAAGEVVILWFWHFFHFLAVAYHPASGIYWFSSSHTEMILLACGSVFLGRLACATDGVAAEVVCGVLIAYLACAYVYVVQSLPYIRPRLALLFETVCLSGVVIAVVQLLRLLVLRVDQDFIFLVLPALILAFSIVSRFRYRREMRQSLAEIDELADDPRRFDSIVTAPKKIVKLYRFGFPFGHSYLLKWELFIIGITRWRSDHDLWHQYIRLLAIYPEENMRLLGAVAETKLLAAQRPLIRGVRKLAKTAIRSRQRKRVSSLSRRLKMLQREVRFAGESLSAYWTALSQGNHDSLYEIVRRAIAEQGRVEAEFLRLVGEYPNCSAVCLAFAQFLRGVMFDLREARHWEERAEHLSATMDVVDICRNQGFVTFPSLPPRTDAGAPKPDETLFADATLSLTEDEKDMTDENRQESLRDIGLNVPLPFITKIRFLVFLHFVVVVTLSCFLPGIPIRNNIVRQRIGSTLISNANVVANRLGEIELLLAVDCAAISGILLNYDDETEVLGVPPAISGKQISDQILAGVRGFTTVLTGLINEMGSILNFGNDAWQDFYTRTIDFTTPETRAHTQATLGAALEYLGHLLWLFPVNTSRARQPYINDSWLEGFQLNVWNAVKALYVYEEQFFDGLVVMTGESMDSVVQMMIIMAVVNGVCFLFYFAMMILLRRDWTFTAKALTLLPKSQIHNCIQRLAVRKSHAVVGKERLYINDCVTLMTASGGHGVLPGIQLASLMLVQLAAAVLGLLLPYLIIGNKLQLINLALMRDRDCSAMCLYMYHSTTAVIYWHAKNRWDPAVAFPVVKEWTESEYGMIISLINEDLNIYADISLFGRMVVNRTAYPLISADSQSIRHDLLVSRGLTFGNETSAYEWVTKHPPLLYIGLIETFLVNVALNITFMSLDPTWPPPPFAISTNDVGWVLGINLMYSHFPGDFVAKWERDIADYLAMMHDTLSLAVLEFTFAPLLLGLAAAIMIFWYLGSIGEAFHFCFGSLCFVDFSMVMDNRVLANLLSGIFPTDEHDLLILSPVIRALPTFASEVVIQLRPDMTVTAVNPAIEERWRLRVTECIDIDLSLILSFPTSVADPLGTNSGTEITLTASQTVVPVNSTAVPITDRGEAVGYILFLEDLSEQRNAAKELAKQRNEADALVASRIPRLLRERLVAEGASMTYVANFAAMLCVQISRFSRLARGGDNIYRIGHFRDRMARMLLDCPRLAHFSTVGITEYVLVDADVDQAGPADTAFCAWEATQTIRRAAVATGVQVSFGMSAQPAAVMGFMSTENLSFGVFAKMTRVARIMALRAGPGVLVVDKMAFPAFPSIVAVNAASVTFMNGSVSYAAFECPIPTPETGADMDP